MAPALAEQLVGVDPNSVMDRASLAALPVLRKSDLIERQADKPPFGGLEAMVPSELARIYASPGPIYECIAHGADPWRYARGLFAGGFRSADIVQNCFSYHFTPAGGMLELACLAAGCSVIPAGTGNTEIQVQVAAHLKPVAYCGTPDFLKVILEKASEMGIELGSFRKAHVTAGPFLPPLQAFYRERGIDAYQSYATADLGLVAYETPAREGLVVDEGAIVEIVRPGTGDPLPDGEVGEVVVTPLNPHYPLLRFATGDMSAVLSGVSPCGRTGPRIKGWMGRADQTTKVRGMFVHPGQIAQVLKRHGEVARARLVVTEEGGQDRMTLKVETAQLMAEGLVDSLAGSLQAVTKLRGSIELVEMGSLPNDGKVIEDARDFG